MNNNIMRELQTEAKVTISACGSLLTPPLLIFSGLKNKQIGKNLHFRSYLMVWGYFLPEGPSSKLVGKNYEGGLITSAHLVVTDERHNSVPRALIETPAMWPAAWSSLLPWKSGRDTNNRILRYSRTVNLFAMVKDKGSNEVKSEQRKLSVNTRGPRKYGD